MDKYAEIFAWPIALVICSVVFMILFRGDISKAIARAKKLGRDGVEMHEEIPEQLSESKKSGAEEFLRSFDNPLIVEVEKNVLNELKSRGINSPAERETKLLRAAATSWIISEFEKAFATIWASQIECLNYLNSHPSGGEVVEIKNIYENAKGKYPQWYMDRPFETWLAYLQLHTLIVEQHGRFFITVRGQEFLKFIVSAQKTLPSAG